MNQKYTGAAIVLICALAMAGAALAHWETSSALYTTVGVVLLWPATIVALFAWADSVKIPEAKDPPIDVGIDSPTVAVLRIVVAQQEDTIARLRLRCESLDKELEIRDARHAQERRGYESELKHWRGEVAKLQAAAAPFPPIGICEYRGHKAYCLRVDPNDWRFCAALDLFMRDNEGLDVGIFHFRQRMRPDVKETRTTEASVGDVLIRSLDGELVVLPKEDLIPVSGAAAPAKAWSPPSYSFDPASLDLRTMYRPEPVAEPAPKTYTCPGAAGCGVESCPHFNEHSYREHQCNDPCSQKHSPHKCEEVKP
jgi:hypothetical protein